MCYHTTESYIDYEGILLRMYYEIADTGKFELLQLKGRINKEKCAQAWEDIIKADGEATNRLGYDKYLGRVKQRTKFCNEYLEIKGALIYLLMDYDMNILNELNVKGYRIYKMVDNSQEEKEKYTESIISASKRVENLVSKIKSLDHEIEEYVKGLGNKKITFNHVIGSLISEVPGLNNPDDIRLAVYNELVKNIRKRKEISNHNTKNNG